MTRANLPYSYSKAYKHIRATRPNYESGIMMLYMMLFLLFLLGSLGLYQKATTSELATFRSSKQGIETFYASEGALNLRADMMYNKLMSQELPQGTSPSATNPCQGSNTGTGDLACVKTTFPVGHAWSYVEGNPNQYNLIRIPEGEKYQGLTAKEVRLTLRAISGDKSNRASTRASMRVKFRLVPVFQFGAIFNGDLEFYPGPEMVINGPVHSNGDLYVASESELAFRGQVTVRGDLYSGAKFNGGYSFGGEVLALNPIDLDILAEPGARQKLEHDDVDGFNGNIVIGAGAVTFPKVEDFDPVPGGYYWDHSDLRIALKLKSDNSFDTIEVRQADGNVDNGKTARLNSGACTDAASTLPGTRSVWYSPWGGMRETGFYDRRENAAITMLEVDMQALLNCLKRFAGSNSLLDGSVGLDDMSFGGLAFFLTVDGPNSLNNPSYYGIRVRNGKVLQSTESGAPPVMGLTVVSDQPIYVMGDYNNPPDLDDRIPAALMGDTINLLSNAYRNANPLIAPYQSSDYPKNGTAGSVGVDSCPTTSCRIATPTTVNAAILAGSTTSGGVDGEDGQDKTPESGGLQNFVRFHENWENVLFTYRGSIASISQPRRTNAPFRCCGDVYNAPIRDWYFEERFVDYGALPPLTPFFSYIRQELFDREYD